MKRFLAIATILFAAVAFAEQPVGSKVGGFGVVDLKGNPLRFSPGQNTLVIFIATRCPVSNDYNERMKAVYDDYNGKGIHFLFVNANSNEPVSEVEQHARDNGFPFPVYKDVNNAVADQFGAEFTPEAFLIDTSGTVRYHGHIDDSRNPARITSQTLRSALDALLAGKPVERADTKAFGCTIKRVRKTS